MGCENRGDEMRSYMPFKLNLQKKEGSDLQYLFDLFDLFFDIKTEEELQEEVEYLVHRLAGIANLLREDGRNIDDYIKTVLGYEKDGK